MNQKTDIFDAGTKSTTNFNQVGISLASPEKIHSWSFGEVKNPETINYRTYKPEKGGLFCERIFGPVKDWECSCGKYKRIKHKGVICDRCGVEVTQSRVRRDRMGHLDLAVPVTHIWFYKSMPSRIGLMLDMTARELERVIYYEDYIVIDAGSVQGLSKGELLSEARFRELEDEHEGEFEAGMGAEALRELLEDIDLDDAIENIEQAMQATRSKQTLKKLSKKLKLVQGFQSSKARPEWMIMTVLPIIPPDLRPLVPLEGGRFATSDLNDLYRRVINRNNRLRNLLKLKTPQVIIRNEMRMLQESVDALLDNGRHGRPVTGTSNRPFKSLSDMLKGKGGRFRQNLLGKRVDYSGRSVIVVGPDLKLHQCGLPKTMALTLFEPFIIRRIQELGLAHTVRSAKKIIDRKTPQVWDILEEVTKGHPVLLNRAPTLHRLSIQAFEPVLIEGSAIKVHPLVCTAYNADFDGDQMAVHVPLSIEAQMEARQLMLATKNIFSPASGRPITTPSQDIILGTYYLTYARPRTELDRENDRAANKHFPLFGSTSEVEYAIASRKISYRQIIRFSNPDFGKETVYGDSESKVIETTPARVRFNEIFPENLGFINFNVSKKHVGDIIWQCYQVAGHEATVKALDLLKDLGFKEATRSGTSIGLVDMVIPEDKGAKLKAAYTDIDKVTKEYRNGVITNGERYQRVVDVWTQTTEAIADSVYRKLEFNDGDTDVSPLFMMVDSAARGNRAQIKQLSGMRGLMAKPSGDIIERPITSNFREGLSVLEYFISTHGARKGLADTALKTADSGYMTRKLVDVAQDVIISETDCGTVNGITISAVDSEGDDAVDLSTRIYGRVSLEKIVDPVTKEVIIDVNECFSEPQAKKVDAIGHQSVKIRSVLSCESDNGCCSQCYGLNLATGKLAKLGEAVGIIAAQSIGEPGTQLTMRTFHVGGVALGDSKRPFIKLKNSGKVVYKDLKSVKDTAGNWVALNKSGSLSILNDEGMEIEAHRLVIGSVITVKDGDQAEADQEIVTWDPNSIPVLTEKAGVIEFCDMIQGITVASEVDKATGIEGMVVTEHREDLHPQVIIRDPKTQDILRRYSIPVGAHLSVKDKTKVTAGMQLARTPRKATKTGDITGGLPRIAELFEARKPKDACVIAKISGEVSFAGTIRGKKKLVVTEADTGETANHLVAMGKHLIVNEGDLVVQGDQLTEGVVSPDDLLEACGSQVLREHLVNQVQSVYRRQGVEINDKHIEIIVSRMLGKVKITEVGDSDFLWHDQVDRVDFKAANLEIAKQGGVQAQAEPVLLGITKASLETTSFISAASFQDTTRVLTEAATIGKVDKLRGFKENVIMGHLIPGGTGVMARRKVRIEKDEPNEGIVDLTEPKEEVDIDLELESL